MSVNSAGAYFFWAHPLYSWLQTAEAEAPCVRSWRHWWIEADCDRWLPLSVIDSAILLLMSGANVFVGLWATNERHVGHLIGSFIMHTPTLRLSCKFL